MHGIWLVSYVVLWVLVVLLCVVAMSLMRLMGQMHQRLGPAPALVTEHGPEIGDSFADILARTEISEDGVLSFPRGRDSLLLFVAPGCPTCESLMWNLKAFQARRDPTVEIVLISTSANVEHNREFLENAGFESTCFLALPKLAQSLNLTVTPYAFWLDTEGVVQAKGLVNTMEHLDSLRNARALGFASINEYHQKVHLPSRRSEHNEKL